MITSINEFFFSNHYAYDGDNRFKTRIKEAKIINKLDNIELAENRLKRALYYIGLEILDKQVNKINNIGVVFGNIYFRQNSKIIPAEIEIDKNRVGNVYVVIISNNTVVTLKLFPLTSTNQIISDDIKNETDNPIQLYDYNGNKLSLEDKKRPIIYIDLDISDDEFNKTYPKPILKNNKPNGIFTTYEIEDMNKEISTRVEKKDKFVPTIITSEMSKLVPNKEFVIYKGMEILVSYPDGPKKKIIRDLVVDEKGASRKFSLVFENTLKPMELNIGTTFIISPKMENDVYLQLLDGFNLEPGSELHFQGPITKFNFYKIGKGGSDRDKLGVIIQPRLYL